MSIPILTFFTNKGGVGKTSLIYHLVWTYASLNKRVVVADMDPQANLTASFLDEDTIEDLWNSGQNGSTIYQSVKPLTEVGDITPPHLLEITSGLYLLPGDVSLSEYEGALSEQWPNSMGDNNLYRPMRLISSFWQVMQMAAESVMADIILVDIGPNLGAINRSVLIATDYVVIPLGADLFSLQGLKNLGPALFGWRSAWHKRLDNWTQKEFGLPQGKMEPIGYLCQQHSVRLDRPVKAYDKWVSRIPSYYRLHVMREPDSGSLTPQDDPYCLATIKHYRSLIAMAQEHRKPVFKLTAADGAIGSHAAAVRQARTDFEGLAQVIVDRIGLPL